jgi:hypothetical protein
MQSCRHGCISVHVMHACTYACVCTARVHVCMCVYVDVVAAWTVLLHMGMCIGCMYVCIDCIDAHTYGCAYVYGPAICNIRSEDDVLVPFYLPGQSACMVGQSCLNIFSVSDVKKWPALKAVESEVGSIPRKKKLRRN